MIPQHQQRRRRSWRESVMKKLGWVSLVCADVTSMLFVSDWKSVWIQQEIQQSGDFFIKPESRVAALDTSQWPLLLKVSSRVESFVDVNDALTIDWTNVFSSWICCCFSQRQKVWADRGCFLESSACDMMNQFIHSLSRQIVTSSDSSPVLGAGPLLRGSVVVSAFCRATRNHL